MRFNLHDKGLLLWIAVLLSVAGVLLIAVPFVVQAAVSAAPAPVQVAAVTLRPVVNSQVATSTSTTDAAGRPLYPTPATSEPPTPAVAVAQPLAPVPAPVPAPKRVPVAKTPVAVGSLGVYRGLGCWVDIYDDPAWRDPSAAVADMASHGVATLYLETSNSRSKFALKDPTRMAEFVDSAHARGIHVVAWYLPDLTDLSKDYNRVSQAIGYRSPSGQRFDSFALDIESGAVKSESRRNAALAGLSARIRKLVGSGYALGAIIPSPVGLAKKAGYWNAFPYPTIGRYYDAVVPMSYYTYHGKGAAAARADTLGNMRILRAQPSLAGKPVHLIGGIAENTSASEVTAFVRASKESGAAGASIYEWAGTKSAYWKALAAIRR